MTQTIAAAEANEARLPLEDKHILIFGGTSGIGLATALQAKAAGARVTVVGLDRDRSRRAAEQHGFADWRAANVTDPEAIREALSDVGQVDHLVLLAGSFAMGKVLEADISLLRLAYEERIWSVVHILRTLGDKLAQDASITLVSGALTHRPDGNGTAIIASACAAVEVLGRGLALELAPRRVNTLSPGPIDTPLLGKTMGEARDGFVRAIEAQHPLHRFGTAEETASAAVFLMTNGYMNGEVLHIDGGSRL
ncbi:SDR family oxidoreductase [Rhizobium sp. CNPSo 3464]|uniref:SDR family oxidoreductase n=1 Tax=Rhizobium sp. CNPSo 3464 TaxID=3021406 RepID=UPI00254CEFBE|nr:SDR family oxidoreductase [Rhizobium sp. CNPSo 3464]MDK4740240.1 SDR family oxidoreductase [Rhizobium sp. CNPSo 3464]